MVTELPRFNPNGCAPPSPGRQLCTRMGGLTRQSDARSRMWRRPSAPHKVASGDNLRRVDPIARVGGADADAQLFFMLFMITPTIAVTIAPDTPPPTSCPANAPMSTPPAPPDSIGMSEVKSEPPATPPTAPAIVLPVGPIVTFFAAPPMAFPPIAPPINWMMIFIRVLDIAFPPLGRGALINVLASDLLRGYGDERMPGVRGRAHERLYRPCREIPEAPPMAR